MPNLARQTSKLSTDTNNELAPLFRGSQRRISEISLVLSSQGIPHRIEIHEKVEIWVEEHQRENAIRQYKLFRKENPPGKKSFAQLPKPSVAPIGALLVPVILFFLPLVWKLPWKDLGKMRWDTLEKAEYFRLFTAQTLHSDSAHIGGNLVAGFFLTLLSSRHLPTGVFYLWMILAGACANFLTCWFRQDQYSSLGFSTFTFACIGALAVLEFAQVLQQRPFSSWRDFQPLAGGTTMALLLGTGPNADILGHAFGFLSGAILIIPFVFIPSKDLKAANPLGWIVGHGLYIGAWFFALQS